MLKSKIDLIVDKNIENNIVSTSPIVSESKVEKLNLIRQLNRKMKNQTGIQFQN